MKVREVTSKSKRLTHLTVWLGIAVLVIAGLVAKDSLVEFYWLSKLDSEIEAERKVAAIKLGEMKSVRAVPRLVRQMIRNAERLLPQMENMGVRERLTKKLQLNGSRVSTSDAFRTLHDVTGLNFVATRSFPEEGEVTFPPKGERNTVAEVVEHLLEQLEIDGVYYVQDGAVILGVPTVRVRKHADRCRGRKRQFPTVFRAPGRLSRERSHNRRGSGD